MSPDEIQGLISFIGTIVQLLVAVLLVALFYMLQRFARRRTYFKIWAWSWTALAISIGALVARYNMAPALDPETLSEPSSTATALYFVYEWAKLVFSSLLLVGTVLYRKGLKIKRALLFGSLLLGSAMYALVSVRASRDLSAVVLWEAPVVIGLLACCSMTLLTLPPSRSSFGSKRTGILFAVMATLWVLYLAAVALPPDFGPALLRAGFDLLVNYNAYLDVLLQMFLGYGMVVMLMEDSRREVDDARAQLEVAHDTLRREALYDPLTGALNRRAFASGVGLDMAKASFGSVVMLDLDNLKDVNDRYGHPAGDVLLGELAKSLQAMMRAYDGLYRWGGDEFLLVLPGADGRGAQRRLEEALARAPHVGISGVAEGVRIEVSTGAAEYAGGEELESAIRRADAEMYREKTGRKRGRNASAPPQGGPLAGTQTGAYTAGRATNG